MKRMTPFQSPQFQQPQHIGEILPDVLARYGLTNEGPPGCGAVCSKSSESAVAPASLDFALADALTEIPLSLSVS